MQLERWLEEREDVVRALALQREIIKILKDLENKKHREDAREFVYLSEEIVRKRWLFNLCPRQRWDYCVFLPLRNL